ncbi:MAG: sugar phosphate isomerase/epimerase family protein, partial [bacterium]
ACCESESLLMSKPVLRQFANLWTLMQHPSADTEWTLDQKLASMKDAGFDGITWGPISGLKEGLSQHRLKFMGGMSSNEPRRFRELLGELKVCGAQHVSTQMGTADTKPTEALGQALVFINEARNLGMQPTIETHRGTCTETPEKTYAIADAYQKVTGELLPLTWDFSHFAVVKHLVPDDFIKKLLVRPDLIQHACQFHFRPFNGHHVQVPVTDGSGNLTQEFKDWLPFAEAVLQCWLGGNRDTEREIFICPEMGPVEGGYGLSTLPNSWGETKVLQGEIQKLWDKVTI